MALEGGPKLSELQGLDTSAGQNLTNFLQKQLQPAPLLDCRLHTKYRKSLTQPENTLKLSVQIELNTQKVYP